MSANEQDKELYLAKNRDDISEMTENPTTMTKADAGILQSENTQSTVPRQPHLSSKQWQSVDDAFLELFGYDWGTQFYLPSDRHLSSIEMLLVKMLGATAAASILQSHTSFDSIHDSRTPELSAPSRKQQRNVVRARPTILKHSYSVTGPSSLSEKLGRQRASTIPAKQKLSTPSYPANAGGMDTLLKQLAGSDKITTVAKTSSDWDQFKDQTGLGEKLEQQAQSTDAYLKRQDFLNRVDHRQFELERKEREQNRIKAMSSKP